MKKLFGLVALLALSFILPARAATEIGTVDEFIDKVIGDPTGDYILTADLEFNKLAAISEFSGTLDGDGHKITGTVSNFMGTVTGTIKNLTIYGLNFEHQRIKSNAVAPMGGFALLLQGGADRRDGDMCERHGRYHHWRGGDDQYGSVYGQCR